MNTFDNQEQNKATKTVLITGGAKRIGNQIAHLLHASGFNIMVHFRSSANAASILVNELNEQRDNSAASVQGDLIDVECIPSIIDQTIETFGRLDVLINNASTFYPTPIELIEIDFWNDLVGSNLRAPAFMVKSATKHLRETNGCIINIVDIYARKPLSNHPLYCSAKAGLEMLTKSLARDLAPEIRVNGVSPGAILWPEQGNSEVSQDDLLERVPLKRMGEPNDIAKTVRFLIEDGTYITGQIIAVDGGRSVVI
ncbi:MAG: pteridine reductase [Acidiferrobacterales bacterium]|nr:pteridine reductase [Acidiferrobacterales bacterium]